MSYAVNPSISASECWWSLSVCGEVKDFSPARWIRRFGQCSKISMSSSRFPWCTWQFRAVLGHPSKASNSDYNEHESKRVQEQVQISVTFWSRFLQKSYWAATAHNIALQITTVWDLFSEFQHVSTKTPGKKARQSCGKLLLTTCRTKSWYSLVNSASWIKGDWSLGRWFGKWWRFCKIVAGSLDWTGFWSGPAARGDPCTSRTMWSAKLKSLGS